MQGMGWMQTPPIVVLGVVIAISICVGWEVPSAFADSYDGTYQGTVTLTRDVGAVRGRRVACPGSALGRPWVATVRNGNGVFRVGERRAGFMVTVDGSITGTDDIGGLDFSGSIDHGPVVSGPLQQDGRLLNGPNVAPGGVEISGSVVGLRLSMAYESKSCAYRVEATRQ